MAGYETGSMENDPSASVCEHGQLKRKCEICSEWKPRALEAEARVEELEEKSGVYREALEHIVKHVEITAGGMAPVSSVYVIATKALTR